VTPPLRVIPPAPGQLAAGPSAPHVALFALDEAAVLGEAKKLRIHAEPGPPVRVVGSASELALLAAALQIKDRPAGTLLWRYVRPQRSWRLRTRELSLEEPLIMGILNLTDDSFSGDGVGRDLKAALHKADALRSAGATIVDVGAETARADRPVVEAEHEALLVAPIVGALAREGHVVSIDTYKPMVARLALESGAEVVNDISGLTLGAGAAEEAARQDAAYVLNYSYGVPKRRPDHPPVYADVVAETVAWLFDRTAGLREVGLQDPQIAIDPGIAFGKSHDEDLQVVRRLGELTTLGLPVLLAHSRKNYIGSVSGRPPGDRDLETHVTTALAYAAGARIFRVHDVAGTHRALDMARALLSAHPGAYAPGGESWPWRAGSSATHMAKAEPDKAPPGGQRW
jgi:dihydropteroate synthase